LSQHHKKSLKILKGQSESVRNSFRAKYCIGRGPIIANLTLLGSAREFLGHFLQTTIINGDRADSKILHLYLGIKTEYMLRAVVWLVSIFNCLANYWTVKDEWKVTWDGPKQWCRMLDTIYHRRSFQTFK